jgi:hypothetical protein
MRFSRNRFIGKDKVLTQIPNFEKVKVGGLHTTYFCYSKKVDCVSVLKMQYTE